MSNTFLLVGVQEFKLLCALDQAGTLQKSHRHVERRYNIVTSLSISLSTAQRLNWYVGTGLTYPTK